MIKNFRIEIFVVGTLLVTIILSHSIDIGLIYYLNKFDEVTWFTPLKAFFNNITNLGDSLWYIIFSIFFIIIYFLIKNKLFDQYTKTYKTVFFINSLLLSSILFSGIITQILKHIIGRQRPSIFLLENKTGFNFFTFDSNFHSFPSGHTSTIFAVALVCAIFIPKLKYFFYFLALVISFSRVVVGAHYITDIFGGIAVAFIGVKISQSFLYKFLNLKQKKIDLMILNNKFIISLVVGIIFVIFLSIGPTFDIFFSSLFYQEENKFILESYYKPSILFRKIILPIILVYIFILPLFSFLSPIQKIYCNYKFKFKEILLLWGSSIFNLVIIINLFLKNLWGRARPNEILEFGGSVSFTPWYQITNQCSTNCSFVSGDAAVGFSLIVFFFFTKNELYFWLSLFFGLSLGFIRILEGGHFLSDINLSFLIIFSLHFLIFSVYSRKSYD